MPIDPYYDGERFSITPEESGHQRAFQDIEYRNPTKPNEVSGLYPTQFGCEACGASAKSLEVLRGIRCKTATAVRETFNS